MKNLYTLRKEAIINEVKSKLDFLKQSMKLNMRDAEKNLDNKALLRKADDIYADLSIQYTDTSVRYMRLNNWSRKSIYECLWDDIIFTSFFRGEKQVGVDTQVAACTKLTGIIADFAGSMQRAIRKGFEFDGTTKGPFTKEFKEEMFALYEDFIAAYHDATDVDWDDDDMPMLSFLNSLEWES